MKGIFKLKRRLTKEILEGAGNWIGGSSRGFLARIPRACTSMRETGDSHGAIQFAKVSRTAALPSGRYLEGRMVSGFHMRVAYN
jgi:hypothetical protein